MHELIELYLGRPEARGKTICPSGYLEPRNSNKKKRQPNQSVTAFLTIPVSLV